MQKVAFSNLTLLALAPEMDGHIWKHWSVLKASVKDYRWYHPVLSEDDVHLDGYIMFHKILQLLNLG